MSFRSLLRRRLLLFILCVVATRLVGQHALMVPHGDGVAPVRKVEGTRPQIEIAGKLIDVPGERLALVKVPEYLPLFVSVRNPQVGTSHVEVIGDGRELNRTFRFRAEFESPYGLDDVFVVLDLRNQEGGRSLFVHEVGQLRARKPSRLAVTLPLAYSIPAGKVKLHVFAAGAEVFHSEMPLGYMQQALDQIVARRIKDVTDAAPKRK
jgi:hypothetical protein